MIPSFALIVRRIRDLIEVENPIFIVLIVVVTMVTMIIPIGFVIYIVIGCLPSNLLINEK